MFSCICSLWSAARNRGIRAQIPNERVFSQCFWPEPEWKYRKAHKQSCSSEISIPNLQNKMLAKGIFQSSYLIQVLTANPTQPDLEFCTLSAFFTALSTHPSQNNASMQMYLLLLMPEGVGDSWTNTPEPEIDFSILLFVPRKMY